MSVGAVDAALSRLASRERDALRAFVPGAAPENDDVARDGGDVTDLDPLSVALPERAYAIVRGDDGRALYTRDGSFALRDGTLVDESGQPVLGYTGTDGVRTELRVDPVDAALGRCDDLRVESDGRVTYDRSLIDPRDGVRTRERVVVGRIALARFPAATPLQPVDALHVRAPGDVVPHVGAPADGTFGALATQRRARGGIDVDASVDALREAYLSLDALASARVAQDGTVKSAMDLLK